MATFPPTVTHRLEGWVLFWADLELGGAQAATTADLRRDVAARARASHAIDRLADHPSASAVRRLFRRAGCDPTRYRPSSEALLRRILKGEELPAIHPIVDLNNCLSVELVVPACVVDVERVHPPFLLRAGRAGESMLSMRGPFDLDGKPLLADQEGPFGTPITDSERVKVRAATQRAWLVAYLPAGIVDAECASTALATLCDEVPGLEVAALDASS